MKTSNKNRAKDVPVPVYEMGTGKDAFIIQKHNPPSISFSVLVFTGFVLLMTFFFMF